MKKLNRKGFTLVELLAVIVILAIVVGIALTTVLPTLKESRQKAFDLTPNTAADFFEKQYQLSLIGDEQLSSVIEAWHFSDTADKTISEDQLKAAGLRAENYEVDDSTWYIDITTGRACVVLKAKTGRGNGGQYYDVTTDTAQSNGCTATD